MADVTELELRSALADAPVGVGLWDAELRYRWVNRALAEINGVPAAAHLGRTIADVLPAMPADVVAVYHGVLASAEPVHGLVVDGETPAQPGRLRSYSISIFPTADGEGRVDGLASFVEDVTELREARGAAADLAAELALERQVLDEVIDRVPLGVTLLWGRELRYRVMNERGRRMLPERGDLVGRRLADVFPETAATLLETVHPLFDSGEELVIEAYELPFDDDPDALDGHRFYDVSFIPVSLTEGEVAGLLVTYLDVTDALRRQRGLERELADERRLTNTLQRALLPRRLPTVPHLDVAARYQPAGKRFDVGGDFYDVFPGRDGAWVAVVGDVCGKGPRAAARTSMVRYALRAEATHADDPATLLGLLNEDVLRELELEGEDDFVTVVLAVVRPGAAGTELTVATAGHPQAIVSSRREGAWRGLGAPGLPVGVLTDARYEQHHDVLQPGERLVLYTDGVLDAHAPATTLTTAGLAALVSGEGPAQAVADATLRHVTASAAPARDDCAVLVLAQA